MRAPMGDMHYLGRTSSVCRRCLPGRIYKLTLDGKSSASSAAPANTETVRLDPRNCVSSEMNSTLRDRQLARAEIAPASGKSR